MKIIEQGVETYLNNSVLVKEGGGVVFVDLFVCLLRVQNCYGQKITSPYISLSLPQTSCQFPCFATYFISFLFNIISPAGILLPLMFPA